MEVSDTIAAISTPPGEGGISIIRLSGKDAINIAKKVYVGKALDKVSSHTINYGHIVNASKEEVDEVMVSVMRSPKTYTRENVVEINCHGGLLATNDILQLVLENGARLAEPGEFTKRAFLNGRIDLTQSEAVMDLIRAKTDESMKIAVKQLDGSLNHLIKNLRQDILDVLAKVEVNIDYPEYDDVEKVTGKLLLEKAQSLKGKIEELLVTAKQGKILRNGVKTAIIGRPNVGKSSLLNTLLHENKAIVTDVPGTTRDVVEEYINVAGVPLDILDTAGIHNTNDKVEKIGVERSKENITKADLILLVLDQSHELTPTDKELLASTKKSKRIIVLNKEDLPSKFNVKDLKSFLNKNEEVISLSAKDLDTVNELEQSIKGYFFNKGLTGNQNNLIINNARHVDLLKQALKALNDVIEGLKNGMPLDLVQIDMTTCWELLGKITGDSYSDELLDELFSQFCLGK